MASEPRVLLTAQSYLPAEDLTPEAMVPRTWRVLGEEPPSRDRVTVSLAYLEVDSHSMVKVSPAGTDSPLVGSVRTSKPAVWARAVAAKARRVATE